MPPTVVGAKEQKLVAKAQELLGDYKPPRPRSASGKPPGAPSFIRASSGRSLAAPSTSALPAAEAKALKRAGRLAAAAQALGDLNIEKVAADFQRDTGGSGIEAVAVAAAALNATLHAALRGQRGPGAIEEAERQARGAARKNARDMQAECWRQQQRDEQGPSGDNRREDQRMAIDTRTSRAVESKAERIADSAAERKALREERQMLASTRRTMSEARAKYGGGARAASAEPHSFENSPRPVIDDSTLQKARALCNGASTIVAQLDEQNKLLRNRSTTIASWSPSRASVRSTPTSPKKTARQAVDADSERLMAKARELLVDYEPTKKRPPVPSAPKRAMASNAGFTAEVSFDRARRNLVGK